MAKTWKHGQVSKRRHGRERQEEITELYLVSDVGRCLLTLEDVAQAAGEKGNDQAELSVLKHALSSASPHPCPSTTERLDSKQESK